MTSLARSLDRSSGRLLYLVLSGLHPAGQPCRVTPLARQLPSPCCLLTFASVAFSHYMCCLLSPSLSLPLGVCVCVRSFCHCHCLARGRGRGGEAEACREGGSTHANENTLRLAGDNGEATQKANLKQRFLLMAPRPSTHLPIYPSALWYAVSLPPP